MHPLAKLDHQYLWHPFTQMKDWLKREPIVITSGEGTLLWDIHGNEYLDANSSIWTNLHGHRNPALNRAIASQLDKIAHSSALGFANEPASLLAKSLVALANPKLKPNRAPAARAAVSKHRLAKVFFSDDGSTAMEVALKLSYEFARRTIPSRAPRFLSLEGGYHGDTVGGVSLGHIDLFHKAYKGLLFKTDRVASPNCYRCPFNRAKPERTDARASRECNWECVGLVEQRFASAAKKGRGYTGMVIEPLIQGAAGMIAHPHGWLSRVAEIVRANGAHLIADEVMTGFGRTGLGNSIETGAKTLNVRGDSTQTRTIPNPFLFASHHEGVQPDFLVMAKGLTGGYLPMAATLMTQTVFDAFLGEYREFKTFFHGHSFTANQLGAAAANASLELLQTEASIRGRAELENQMKEQLRSLWEHPKVGDVRQVGLIAGIELVKRWETREPFPLEEQRGIRICEAMAKRGVLTRPIGNVIVLMPPYCTTPKQLASMIGALRESLEAMSE